MLRFRYLLLAAALVAGTPGVALANGGSKNFVSTLRSIEPKVRGLELEVVHGDDALELRNETGGSVLVSGYDGEPYLRFARDGTVEENVRSPAKYLNADRYATQPVPGRADPDAEPSWRVVSGSGAYAWHDHRIHWMSTETPGQVEDESERTKIFDWRVPIQVEGRPVEALGTLHWTPAASSGDDFPAAAAIALGVVAVLSVALVIAVRRRRRPPQAGDTTPTTEAW